MLLLVVAEEVLARAAGGSLASFQGRSRCGSPTRRPLTSDVAAYCLGLEAQDASHADSRQQAIPVQAIHTLSADGERVGYRVG
jgi:hypothetical protein